MAGFGGSEGTTVGQVVESLDTNAAAGLIHDGQMDYYGKRVAAAAADNTVHVWDITYGQQKSVGQLKGHEGPVWKAAWAHPQFGSLIATCGYDMKIIIWKEMPAYSANWHIAYVDSTHTASVNDLQFCPWEYGLRLACASSDGTCSVLTYGPDCQWRRDAFKAHSGGAQAISWMPAQPNLENQAPVLRLATGGCDSSVCIWKCIADGDEWKQEMPPFPPVHTDWVRAVAWRPEAPGGSCSIIASGSWDKSVVVWMQPVEGQPWRQKAKLTVDGKVESLSWSVTGSILAVSYGEGDAVLYKESLDGGYIEVGTVDEAGFIPKQVDPSLLASGPPTSSLADGLAGLSLGGMPPAAAAPPVDSGLQQQQASVMEAFGM